MVIEMLLEQARRQVLELPPEMALADLADYLVVDVREPHEVLQGFLPGAIHVPRGLLEFWLSRDPRFSDRSRPVLLYSGSGDRAVLAALSMKALGYTSVATLEGGIERWATEGLPMA